MNKETYIPYEKKLDEYLIRNNIQSEKKTFEEPCRSVEEAVRTVNAEPNDFIKNICLINHQNKLIVASVGGAYKISRKKIAQALNIPMPTLAYEQEVQERTGYPIGGIPPFGYEAIHVIDDQVMTRKQVYTSAGTPYALLEMKPQTIQETTHAIIANIRKK